MNSYNVVKTSSGGSLVKNPQILEEKLKDIDSGKFVVWSNDAEKVMYVEDSLEMADSAESCGGDYSSVVVQKL